MPKFQIAEVLSQLAAKSVRLGAGSGAANHVDSKEVGKALKLGAESRYVLCAAGDPIEAFLESVEPATLDDFSIGAIRDSGYKEVVLDGLQATPGTGTIAVGDWVVTGTVVAKGTALTQARPKVCKATNQPGAVITVAADANDDGAEATAAFALMTSQLMNARFGWRVVSIASPGTGAVGDIATIERIGSV